MGKEPAEMAGRLPPADPHPWLVYRGEDRIFCQISPLGVVDRESRPAPELQDSQVVYCSPDGRRLVLLEQKGPAPARRVSIWNPITRESIELPLWTTPGDGSASASAVLSCSPDDPNCVVYILMTYSCQFAFCRVGDERWSFVFLDHESLAAQKGGYPTYGFVAPTHRRIRQPVSLKGRVFGLTNICKLVEMSVDASNCSFSCIITELADPVAVAETYHPSSRTYLVPWEDRHLYQVAINFPKDTGASNFGELPVIRVFAFSFSDNSWYQVSTLRGGAIFLDDSYCLASSSYKLGNWSFVYYTCYYTRKLYSYRLEDGKVTSYAPCPHLRDPCWIMTPHHKPSVDDDSTDDGKQKVSASARCSKKRKALENDADCSKKQKAVGNGTSFRDLLPELIERIAEKVSSFVEYTYFLNINRLGSDAARRREKKFRPCLIYRDRMETSVHHIVGSNLSREVRVEIPQDARGKRIACSRDGWLLLVEDGMLGCLYNPLTRKVIETDRKLGGLCRRHISSSSLTFIRLPDKSSVLTMSNLMGRRLELPSGATEAGKGKAVWWELEVPDFQASCNSPVFLGEDLYYRGYDFFAGSLGRFRLTDMEEGKYEWKVEKFECPCKGKYDSLRCPCKKCYTRNYLTECGGELLSVFIDADCESWVRVFKLGGSDTEKEWEEIDSLGGYCLYLDSTSSMSCIAETLDMADRIYFPKFYRDGLVYYSLKTMKYHSVGNEQDEVGMVNTVTMFSDCGWIIPDFSH